MKRPILNPDFTLPADGWVQLTPKGTFWHPEAEINQLIDDKAIDSMVNRINEEKTAAGENFAGLLMDFDHFSSNTNKPSGASGWIMELQNRADGMWAQLRWTGSGKAAVKSGDYRFTSPVWKPSDCEVVNRETSTVRPLRLDRAALTNDPNLKGMAPITNRAALKDFRPVMEERLDVTPFFNQACTREMLDQPAGPRAATKADLEN